MSMKLYAITAAADEVGFDRSVLTRVLRNTAPDSRAGAVRKYRLATVVRALMDDVKAAAGGGALDLSNERAKLTQEQRKTLAIKNRKDDDKWCEIAKAIRAMEHHFVIVRERVLNIAINTMSGMPAADPVLYKLIEKECHACLTELSTDDFVAGKLDELHEASDPDGADNMETDDA